MQKHSTCDKHIYIKKKDVGTVSTCVFRWSRYVAAGASISFCMEFCLPTDTSYTHSRCLFASAEVWKQSGRRLFRSVIQVKQPRRKQFKMQQK